MLLVTDLRPGGTPNRIARLARGLRDDGVTVCVGCLAREGPVSEQLRQSGIATFACNAERPRDLYSIVRLVRYVRKFRPDVIHSTLMHANIAARLAGLWTGVPVLTSTATIEVERPWHRIAEVLTARIDAGHLVNSRAIQRHVAKLLHVPRSRIHLIPPSIDPAMQPSPGTDSHVPEAERAVTRAQLGLADHEFAVLWVGRFDPVKRLDIVIRVAEIMSDLPCRFLLVGDGPSRAEIEQRLRLSSAGRRVELLGWRDDLRPIYRAADAFLFPSLTEGMPNAVLEAMACGLAVVGSDIPVLRELSGGQNRLLVVRGDEPRAYADVLGVLARDPEQRKAISAAAAAWIAETCSPRETIRALRTVYESVATRCRGPRA